MTTQNNEFKALKEMREISIAMRELQNQASSIAKRYKQGIKTLEKESASIEACLDDGGWISGTEPWDNQSPELRQLIADPQLKNIPEDVSV
jgi:hypothetical protein